MRAAAILLIATSAFIASACAESSVQKSGAANMPSEPRQSPAYTVTPQPLESDRISLADAKKEFDADSAVFVDVRSPEAFKQERIRGALNISLAELDSNLNKFPKGKKIIVYCS